ncbi:hypothetical protein DNTS_032942 [Danionella cerebrum]|uniref:Uncharacterized protein n=1 Tax=Danionella cerebrum TaxID=2873325 RepID=A0A553Q2C7_9TELE|nr:hypothetical protein DNTS_032942 [Danionella translucida]
MSIVPISSSLSRISLEWPVAVETARTIRLKFEEVSWWGQAPQPLPVPASFAAQALQVACEIDFNPVTLSWRCTVDNLVLLLENEGFWAIGGCDDVSTVDFCPHAGCWLGKFSHTSTRSPQHTPEKEESSESHSLYLRVFVPMGGKQWDSTEKEMHASPFNNSRRRKKAHYMLANQPTAIILVVMRSHCVASGCQCEEEHHFPCENTDPWIPIPHYDSSRCRIWAGQQLTWIAVAMLTTWRIKVGRCCQQPLYKLVGAAMVCKQSIKCVEGGQRC